MINLDSVKHYIALCDAVIDSGDIDQAKNLFIEIKSLFECEIPHFMNGLKSEMNSASLYWEHTNPYWLDDIPLIKAKLQNAIAMNNQVSHHNIPNIVINNNNSNSATYNNSLDIDTILQTTQFTIKEMNSLSDEETKIALEKVNELSNILQSKENRKSKWSKVASVFKWLADKSVDLACAFSPLIMQALRCLH